MWNEIRDRYFLKLLDVGLNKIPACSKPIDELTDKECEVWIKKSVLTTSTEVLSKSYKVDIPQVNREFPLAGKSEYLILPLSLENNSTLTGTASILEQFSGEFQIPCKHASRHFVFDESGKCYNISAARKHHEFMIMMFNHRKNAVVMEQQMRSTEKTIMAEDSNDSGDREDGSRECEGNEITVAETTERTKCLFQQQDGNLVKLYNRTNNEMLRAMQSKESEALSKLVKKLQDTQKEWEDVEDHLGRNILHYAVEYNNTPLVKTLLSSGLNINIQEGCGATPLSIAVLNRNTAMCELLVKNFASFSGPLYASMPSPMDMAKNMELTEIMELFVHEEQENDDIENIINDGNCLDVCMELPDMEAFNDEDGEETINVAFDRSIHVECPTAIVGDQGTCKVLRSTKNRSQEAFKWVAEVPGDLHTKGYLCEAAYKAQKSGVFVYLINKVMKRPKVTDEAFRARKFQQQNLSRIQEAVRDGAMAIGLAAVKNFSTSPEFPSKDDFDEQVALSGNCNKILLESFKHWLSECADKDTSFAYTMQMFHLFGPLLEGTNDAVRNGLGSTREAIWKILLPIFAQLQFRNYWTEALVHVVNFTAVWPIAFREMMKRNCSISLSGKEGHDLAMDEFVEEHLVRPLKAYVTGNSTGHFINVSNVL